MVTKNIPFIPVEQVLQVLIYVSFIAPCPYLLSPHTSLCIKHFEHPGDEHWLQVINLEAC